MLLTRSERNSILFYQGGTGNIELSDSERHLRSFYKVKNAYEAINVLLFPGFDNETARLIQENREIDQVLLDFMPELLNVYENLYRVMCRYAVCLEKRDKIYVYRNDRMQTLAQLKAGQLPCFFSTSLSQKVNPYFREKKGLLLLELEASGKIPHLDVNAVLGTKSAFKTESEILFPPFLGLELEPMELNEREKSYRDMDGDPPEAKYKIYLKEDMEEPKADQAEKTESEEMLLTQILNTENLQNAKEIWKKCSFGFPPDETAKDSYTNWKKALQQYLKMKYAGIQSCYLT